MAISFVIHTLNYPYDPWNDTEGILRGPRALNVAMRKQVWGPSREENILSLFTLNLIMWSSNPSLTCTVSTDDPHIWCSISEMSSLKHCFCWASWSLATTKLSSTFTSSSSSFCSTLFSSLSRVALMSLNPFRILCLSVCIWFFGDEKRKRQSVCLAKSLHYLGLGAKTRTIFFRDFSKRREQSENNYWENHFPTLFSWVSPKGIY